MTRYKSNPMQCNVGDDDCPICRFLNGSRETADLMAVIRMLDKKLSAAEEVLSIQCDLIADLTAASQSA